MSEAKGKEQLRDKSRENVAIAEARFWAGEEFPAFHRQSENSRAHAVRGFHHLMYQLFIRAKHLHYSTLRAMDEGNSYVFFLLTKAYVETVAMLGYCFIEANRLIELGDYSALLDWAERHAMGGKKWPSDEMVSKKGRKREDFTQTNLLTMIQRVDKDFNKSLAKEKRTTILEDVYKGFVAEAGHPTYLGLSICLDYPDGDQAIPNINKIGNDDDININYSHLAIADLIVFSYWDKFLEKRDEQLREARFF